ncbi:MAG: TldD/PmbA family protein [Myxococcota bacterium]|nr:TldD/PmbA family protein [Myxococcota bacterium]
MLDERQSRQMLAKVIALAKKQPGAEAVASLRSARTGNTRFAVNEITTSGDVATQDLSVTVKFGKRSASATTNQLDDRSLADVVARAARMAKLSPENAEAMPVLGKQTYRRPPGARDAATAKLGPEPRAKAAGTSIAHATSSKVTIAGYYENADRTRGLASTAGLSAFHAWTTAGMTCTARTPDGTGSGWAGGASNRAADFDPDTLAKIAVDKGVKSAKPTRLDAGRYTVVLEPAAVADLLGFLTDSFNARRADEGRSFFSKPGGGTKVGEKLFPDFITLRTDPNDVQIEAQPFDGSGFPLAPTTWVDKGVVKGLVYDRYWAQKHGKQSTGQPSGWVLDGGKATREDLIKGVKRGVLITRFWYLRWIDPQSVLVTGLTRDGVFMIENGAITRPVNNFRFNESPVQMLGKCDALTPSVVHPQGGMRVPMLRTHEFNLASISEAV